MDYFELSGWIIFFLVASAQGIFLSILLYLKDANRLAYLAASILLYSFMIGYYVTYWSGYNTEIPRALGVSMGFTFLIGPFLLFYVQQKAKNITLHISPFLLNAAVFLILPQFPNERAIVSSLLAVAQCIHLIVYCILIKNSSKESKWAKIIFFAFSGYTITFLTYYVLVWTGTLKLEYDYFISLASSLFIYYTGYKAVISPKELIFSSDKKYQKSALSLSASRSILKTIRTHMDENKAYRDNELKLTTLADQLGLSPNHISQVINELTQYNFSDFVNKYRIEEAKSLIETSENKPVFIEIAFDVGFNNKASFNNAFKKFTQMSPSSYYNSLTQKMSA
ncbi:helix-turn-helix domain-containing protein [Fulvivirga lutea]|uniref:AraC family transcriptional regulator n=1 Tax=Fulvivirga lutea TaxID=2810512 RepID=A0A974WEI3_9BACT|nr:helix-turn-helix domain-containing protein [Fulvivirga lutea]QSE96883.1 AraC family transcriptional regulator [Fulvivirga lutea]